MIDYNEALAGILDKVRPCPVVRVRADRAFGNVLAQAMASPVDLPPFDNSAMDGFALHGGGAALAVGAEFAVTGLQVAGDAHALAGQGAWEITTGAALPAGLDTVVPVEQVDVIERDAAGNPRRIRLTAAIEPGRHVRRHGEDVAVGEAVLTVGARVLAPQLAMLASLGVAEVPVVRAPRVALICTGRELVDDPSQALVSGQIRNSNGPYLAARIVAAGAELVLRKTVGDEPAEFLAAAHSALERGAEVIISTGAVSMGRHDFVPDALRQLGATEHFHKVRIRPGKPLLFASMAAGTLFFGLPGNPVSSAVGLRFFVEPALRAMLGLGPEQPLRLPLATRYDKRAPLRCFLKGRAVLGDDGRLQAQVLDGQESFRIRPLLETTAWVVLDEAAQACEAGTIVDVHGLGHWQPVALGSAA